MYYEIWHRNQGSHFCFSQFMSSNKTLSFFYFQQVKVRRFERISEDLSEKTPVKPAEKPPVKTAEKLPVKTAEKSPEKVTQTTQTTKSPEISKKMCIKCKNAEGTCDFLVEYQPYFDKWENPLQTNLLKAICENCQVLVVEFSGHRGCLKKKFT